MQIGVIGINHKTAHLELRENFAKVSVKHFGQSIGLHHAFSYVLLTTCNRIEIYFSSEDLAITHTYLLGILRHELGCSFEHKVYSFFGIDCFSHLAKVTSGMDSAIIGETEIQGQVKQAYETAMKHRLLSRELHFLFQKCLKIGKEIRFETSAPTLDGTVYTVANSFFPQLDKKKILFVGISEINLKVYKKFQNIKSITFCNRTLEKAILMGRGVLPWEELFSSLCEYDILIFGTKALGFILKREKMEKTVEKKLVIDLSLPRNVDPEIGRMEKITLLNIDQINQMTAFRRKGRDVESEKERIGKEVEKQIALFQKRESFYLAECKG